MLWLPTARINLIAAVLLLVTCATPKTAAPSQCATVASQRVTCPFVTGELAPVTVAVRVIAVSAATLPDEMFKVVVVGLELAYAHGEETKKHTAKSTIAANGLVLDMVALTCCKQDSESPQNPARIATMRGFSEDMFPSLWEQADSCPGTPR